MVRFEIESSELLRVIQVALANGASARILVLAAAHAVRRHISDHFVRTLGRIAARLVTFPLAVVED